MGPTTGIPPNGVAYPSTSTIAGRPEPSAPPSPEPPPHSPRVAWATEAGAHDFRQDSQTSDRRQEAVSHIVPEAVMTLRTHIRVLRLLGLLVCAWQIAAAAAIPIATYLLVTKPFARYAIENYVHWGVSLVAGAVGMLALGSMRPGALAFHIVLGGMFAAALGAHNSSEYASLETKCKMAQQAFVRCAACSCAALNSCTKGPVTVFLMSLPLIFSLLALLKVETASGITTSARVARALAAVTQQIAHLHAHEPLSVPLDELMKALRELEAEGGPSLLSIATQCRIELARAGFNVPPRGFEGKKDKSGDNSLPVVASAHSTSHNVAASQHSAHSLAHSHASAVNMADWHRAPQPSAMSFPTATGRPESSIYYTPQGTSRM